MTTLAPELDRDRLVEENLDLLNAVAQSLLHEGLCAELDDLVMEGFEGLRSAARRFDPERGIYFRTYAAWRVRGAMLDYARAQDWLPRSARRAISTLDRARNRFAVREGRFPSDQELADDLGWTMAAVAKARRQALEGDLVSLQSEVRVRFEADGQAVTLGEITPDPDADTEREAITEIARSDASALLMRLTERERFVLSLAFYEDLTLREIGEILGVTESRVSQIRTRALKRLRAMVEPELRAAA